MKFEWTAKDVRGKVLHGQIIAGDDHEVKNALNERGLRVVEIKSPNQPKKINIIKRKFNFTGGLPIKQKLFLFKGLMWMINSGVPLLQVIESLESSTKDTKTKKILKEIRRSVVEGRPMSEVFKDKEKEFPEYYSAYISAGEISGQLVESFQILYKQIERDYESRMALRNAMAYPSVVLFGVVVVVITLFTYVLPQLKDTFTGLGVEPHLLLSIMFWISDFVLANWIILVLLFFISVAGFIYLLSLSNFRLKFIYLLMRLPVLGNILKNVQLSRFNRTIALGLQAGVSFPVILGLTARVLQGPYKKAALDFAIEIERGVAVSELVAKHKDLFPDYMVRVIKVGESTGRLAHVLGDLAEYFDDEVTNNLKFALSLVEPFLIVIVGLVVGSISVSMILTIYRVIGNLAG